MWQKIRELLKKDKYDSEAMARKIAELNYKEARNHVQGQKFYYILRNIWGVLLAIVLVISIGFQYYLAYHIGKGYLNFKEYKEFLGIITGGNFVQVLGLCYIVVNYLFPKKDL
jgi:hypothetical protein